MLAPFPRKIAETCIDATLINNVQTRGISPIAVKIDTSNDDLKDSNNRICNKTTYFNGAVSKWGSLYSESCWRHSPFAFRSALHSSVIFKSGNWIGLPDFLLFVITVSLGPKAAKYCSKWQTLRY